MMLFKRLLSLYYYYNKRKEKLFMLLVAHCLLLLIISPPCHCAKQTTAPSDCLFDSKNNPPGRQQRQRRLLDHAYNDVIKPKQQQQQRRQQEQKQRSLQENNKQRKKSIFASTSRNTLTCSSRSGESFRLSASESEAELDNRSYQTPPAPSQQQQQQQPPPPPIPTSPQQPTKERNAPLRHRRGRRLERFPLTFPRKKGRIVLDLSPNTEEDPFSSSLNAKNNYNNLAVRQFMGHPDDAYMSITLDPFSLIRFMKGGVTIMAAFGAAFMGTLRLLAPMIVARRVLCVIGEHLRDYLTGRYLRKTYKEIENNYRKKYQIPDACRSIGRTIVHTLILMQFGVITEWLLGLSSRKPCMIVLDDDATSCSATSHWLCGMLWIIAIVEIGHICTYFMETLSNNPLRIHASSYYQRQPRKRVGLKRRMRFVFAVLKDPDEWITKIAKGSPKIFTKNNRDYQVRKKKALPYFKPDPLLFPATWQPLNTLLFFAVAKAMASASSRESMHSMMKMLIFQQAFGDEWYRVFLREKRITLGVCSHIGHFISTIILFIHVTLLDNIACVCMVPSLLAVTVSGWMNMLIFWEAHIANDGQQVITFTLSQNGRHSGTVETAAAAAQQQQARSMTSPASSSASSSTSSSGTTLYSVKW